MPRLQNVLDLFFPLLFFVRDLSVSLARQRWCFGRVWQMGGSLLERLDCWGWRVDFSPLSRLKAHNSAFLVLFFDLDWVFFILPFVDRNASSPDLSAIVLRNCVKLHLAATTPALHTRTPRRPALSSGGSSIEKNIDCTVLGKYRLHVHASSPDIPGMRWS